MGLKYRPDIDGLRALAVLSVFIYHLDSKLLPGGFLGVDIFFVLSGYLITNIIYQDIVSFSFFEFYSRRIKRIAPAFFLIILVTLGVGYLILLPRDLYNLTNSAFANLFFASNIYFANRFDYFADSSEFFPLLHTWSLAVEEQFYLFWPIFLFYISKYLERNQVIILSITLATLSFVMAQYLSSNKNFTSYSYYLPFTRSGELLIGALLAISNYQAKQNSYLSFIGIVILIGCLFTFDKEMVFPGLSGMIPCLAVALLILGGQNNNSVTRVLSNNIVVLIGLMSYSIYLWHWPLLAFAKYLFDTTQLPWAVYIAIVFMTFSLSYFSWRFIEKPARNIKNYNFVKLASFFYLIPSLIVVALFVPSYNTFGLPDRYGEGAGEFFVSGNIKGCLNENFKGGECSIGASQGGGSNDTLLIGDSHSSQLAVMLNELGKLQGFSIDARHVAGCWPMFNEPSEHPSSQLRNLCDGFKHYVFNNPDDYQSVILALAWSHHIFDDKYVIQLQNTLSELEAREKKVILIAQIPAYKYNHTKIFYVSSWINDRPIEKNYEYQKANKKLLEISRKYRNVNYYDFEKNTSKEIFASPIVDGKPVYFNANHLSVWGSKYLGHELKDNLTFYRLLQQD